MLATSTRKSPKRRRLRGTSLKMHMSVATGRQVVQTKINPDSGGHMHPQGIRTFFTRPMHVSSFVCGELNSSKLNIVHSNIEIKGWN